MILYCTSTCFAKYIEYCIDYLYFSFNEGIYVSRHQSLFVINIFSTWIVTMFSKSLCLFVCDNKDYYYYYNDKFQLMYTSIYNINNDNNNKNNSAV